MKKNIAILSVRNLTKAPRIDREIIALKEHYNVHIIGETKTPNLNVDFFSLYSFRTFTDKILNRFFNKKNFSKLKKHLIDYQVELLIIHEPHFLPLAVKLKQEMGLKLVFNAHEYHPLEFDDVPGWKETKGKEMNILYEQNLSKIDLFINVSEGIKEKCITEYGKNSVVIPNAAYSNDIKPTYNHNGKIKIIHHGVILPSRKIEKMIEVVKNLDDSFTFDIMGVSSNNNLEYFNKIKESISNIERINFIEPVAYSNIIQTINQYDIGFYILDENSFNNKHALPNKFFEFIQAKLAIAISPSPEMKQLVEKYEIGMVAKDFNIESMVEVLKDFDFNIINKFKENTMVAAKIENAEYYQGVFLDHIKNLFN